MVTAIWAGTISTGYVISIGRNGTSPSKIVGIVTSHTKITSNENQRIKDQTSVLTGTMCSIRIGLNKRV